MTSKLTHMPDLEQRIRDLSNHPGTVVASSHGVHLHMVELRGGPGTIPDEPHSVPILRGHATFLEVNGRLFPMPLAVTAHLVSTGS